MDDFSFPETQGILPEQAHAAAQSTRQLVTVRCLQGSRAVLAFFEDHSGAWEMRLCCEACIGKAGAGKTREGDMKTPLGQFSLSVPFGILSDPSANDPLGRTIENYLHVHANHYWCGQSGAHYNRLMDASLPCPGWHPSPADEHLISYAPSYHYGMFIDYNREGKDGLGSAIFLHCTGTHPYTAGCVAVEESVMRELILSLKEGASIFIFQ